MTKQSQSLPAIAKILGGMGLIPFIACAVQITSGWPMGPRATGPALYALLLYSALIISFLGGVQWGLVLSDQDTNNQTRRFIVSNLPTLAAWSAAWIGGKTGLLFMAAILAVILAYEHWSATQSQTPSAYVQMRNGLTAVACAALLTSAFLGPFA
ncbi:MAG: DUF3429 domain-containing protein [Hyphomicrobiaceae bacterium]|nr:DUF3429 domain-containing protein [Hyphomicrobiaceae bacterium]